MKHGSDVDNFVDAIYDFVVRAADREGVCSLCVCLRLYTVVARDINAAASQAESEAEADYGDDDVPIDKEDAAEMFKKAFGDGK